MTPGDCDSGDRWSATAPPHQRRYAAKQPQAPGSEGGLTLVKTAG
jgi:hypothetical protein